jgi:rubrerythrin
MSIKGTQTEKNLLKALPVNRRAKNRYEFFAQSSSKDKATNKLLKYYQKTASQEQALPNVSLSSSKGEWLKLQQPTLPENWHYPRKP